ncbi:Low copy number virion structural protein [Clostridium felsineum]|uniref:Low copy number virion structural protein n=1 Tax=Clostridium felsineum TaxID=36839 RepID=UPI00214D184C|nr:Low copy number virion structural protein [Clostridium felsineum]MCR3758655.1 Low copy number virion structural protein [Clostridium felsineum]
MEIKDYTQKIISALPYWFEIRKYPEKAIGAKFLEVFGIELQEVFDILDYAYKQTRIDTADMDFTNIVYKTVLPYNVNSNNVTCVRSKDTVLAKVGSIGKFFGINSNDLSYPELYENNVYFIDDSKNILYVKHNYDALKSNEAGFIQVLCTDKSYTLPLSIYKVWNFFDEFGLLLDCPRLYGETNAEYKMRILDVFKNPAGSNKEGLMNAIARELNMRKEIIWQDAGVDLIIEDPMVNLSSIKVDGIKYNENQVYITDENTVLIPGIDSNKGTQKTVSYVSGIEMHSIHNKSDYKMQNELFNSDNSSTDLLKYYVNLIETSCPIMWDEFRWDEAYFDISDKNVSGLGCIPTLCDGSIEGFAGKTLVKGELDINV